MNSYNLATISFSSTKAHAKTLMSLIIAISQTTAFVYARENQDPEAYYKAPKSVHGKVVIIPMGTTFEGRIDTSIGSSISHQGQSFNIVMSTPVLANGIDVLIPQGALIVGEVVEAIPSSHLPHEKNMPKPCGKLRVQLSGLKMPDGTTYPLVANLIGEEGDKRHGRGGQVEGLGGGVGYMGSTSSFEAVAPGMSDRYRGGRGRGPKVLTKEEVMRDPILGNSERRHMNQQATIRSLVRRKNDLYIDSGSPLSVKLAAPFKVGFRPADRGDDLEINQEEDSAPTTQRKSFKKESSSQEKSTTTETNEQPAPVQNTEPPAQPQAPQAPSNPF